LNIAENCYCFFSVIVRNFVNTLIILGIFSIKLCVRILLLLFLIFICACVQFGDVLWDVHLSLVLKIWRSCEFCVNITEKIQIILILNYWNLVCWSVPIVNCRFKDCCTIDSFWNRSASSS
jgi:hypothetical protein